MHPSVAAISWRIGRISLHSWSTQRRSVRATSPLLVLSNAVRTTTAGSKVVAASVTRPPPTFTGPVRRSPRRPAIWNCSTGVSVFPPGNLTGFVPGRQARVLTVSAMSNASRVHTNVDAPGVEPSRALLARGPFPHAA